MDPRTKMIVALCKQRDSHNGRIKPIRLIYSYKDWDHKLFDSFRSNLPRGPTTDRLTKHSILVDIYPSDP